MTKFLTIAQFKAEINASELNVVKNPKSGKLFLSASNGSNYKVQGDLDVNESMCVLIPNGVIADACLINAEKSNNTLATL